MNVLEKILEEIESLHNKILKDKFAEQVTEQEIDSLIKVKEIVHYYMDEMNNDDWIPVEKRIPKEPKYIEDSYIVQTEDIITPFSAYWDGKEWTDVNDEPLEVIAWQPLPKQYKPKVKTKE